MPAAYFDPTPIRLGDAADEDQGAATAELAVEDDVVTTTITFGYDVEQIEQAQEIEVDRIVSNISRSDLTVNGSFTTWEQLRDYVCAAIESQVGAFPRNPVKEKAIFSSFMNRWDERAEAIARRAVEVHGCWWQNAPLSVNRFCKGSDPYFAEIIASQI